jgi:hypothetical protein
MHVYTPTNWINSKKIAILPTTWRVAGTMEGNLHVSQIKDVRGLACTRGPVSAMLELVLHWDTVLFQMHDSRKFGIEKT